MKLVKVQSKSTYKNKAGKEVHYYNYVLVDDNGHRIQIKPAFIKDLVRLDCMSVYEK